ncbi:hypothetical protein GCM10008997_34860 [Halomonas salifodinae]
MTLGKVGQDSEAGSLPSQELLEAMDWPEGPQDRGYRQDVRGSLQYLAGQERADTNRCQLIAHGPQTDRRKATQAVAFFMPRRGNCSSVERFGTSTYTLA